MDEINDIGIITVEDIKNAVNPKNDISHKRSPLPPLEQRKDDYSKMKIKANKLIDLFKK